MEKIKEEKAQRDAKVYMQNRELSWLKFNERVLNEAEDETVPLLERLKFVAIYSSNLSEFFMIRVGSLFELSHMENSPIDSKSGLSAQEQLDAIYKALKPLYKKKQEVYFDLENQLRINGIYHLGYDELSETEEKYVKHYFRTNIVPVLSLQIIDTHHPFPHLVNGDIYISAVLRRKGKNKNVLAILPIPKVVPSVIYLPEEELRYIDLKDIILANFEQLINEYDVIEKVALVVTRNADLKTDDEVDDESDFRKTMQKSLLKRKRLAPVVLELAQNISEDFLELLLEYLSLKKHQAFVTDMPLKVDYAFTLENKLSDSKKKSLIYAKFTPVLCNEISLDKKITKQIQQKDLLLTYPYESMEPFLYLLKESATDNNVISIKITIYRLASNAKLVDYLCLASENGKEVSVLIELRARFDEQNNIDWSQKLEEAGCNVIYGFAQYKVHSKICLITRKDKGRINYITHIGTGNFNEKTAKIYTDLSLITADYNIGLDASAFFNNMAIGNANGEYKHLLVAPVSLKNALLNLIDEEIKKGKYGKITIKINSLTDIDIIEKLRDASVSGVKIKMIIRGICCLVPNVEDETENVSICSLVGRFLEHSRIYCFGTGDNEKIYISSADFMTRNTQRRVEIACPIYAKETKDKIKHILDVIEDDTAKVRVLQNNGEYVGKCSACSFIDSQAVLMQEAIEKSKVETVQSTSFWSKFMDKFKNS